jgi:uncharacterized membrane protein YqhA
MNYCMVGLPGTLLAYWALKPHGEVKKASSMHFLTRILPLPMIGGLILGIGETTVFFLSDAGARQGGSNTLVLLSTAAFGYAFFAAVPRVYRGTLERMERLHLAILGLLEVVLVAAILPVGILRHFFTVADVVPSRASVASAVLVTLLMVGALLAATSWYRLRAIPRHLVGAEDDVV